LSVNYGYLVGCSFNKRSLRISNNKRGSVSLRLSGVIQGTNLLRDRKYSTTSLLRKVSPDLSSNGAGILNNTKNPYYLTGFIDGEGCFNLTITKHSELSTGWNVIPTFKISLHNKDRALLEYIKGSLGVGNINKHGKNSSEFRVNGLKNLNVIIKHLDSYPLITKKYADFALFKKAVEMIGLKEHLTKEGLLKLVSIKASINNGLSSKLKSEFPGIIPAIRPDVLSTEIKDMNWLSGFTEAEGSFYIVIQEDKDRASPTHVSLRFALTQHSRDKVLMESLIKLLGCGRCSSPSSRKEVNFIVSTISGICNSIIPLFQKYPLLGKKQKDFLDFMKAAEIIKSKDLLSSKGVTKSSSIETVPARSVEWLAQIKNIKNGMNQRRPSDFLKSNNFEADK
jgi:hypothetical protein